MGNWTKVLQDSMSPHNVTNADKLKLINYNRNTEIFKCKILVGKTLTIQHALIKFIRLFHRQSFMLYGTSTYASYSIQCICLLYNYITPCT